MVFGVLDQQHKTMSQRQQLRGEVDASPFSRSPVAGELAQQEGMRSYASCGVTSSIAATTRAAAAAFAVALAGIGIYEALILSAGIHEHALAYKPPHVCLRPAHPHCSASAGDRPVRYVDILARPSSGADSLPARHFCESAVHRWRYVCMIVATARCTYYGGKRGYTRSDNGENRTISDRGYLHSSNGAEYSSSYSGKACKASTSTNISRSNITNSTGRGDRIKYTGNSCNHRDVSVHIRGGSHWYGVFPSVTGALAERPLHLLEPATKTGEEDADENEIQASEAVDPKARSFRRRGLSSTGISRASDYSFVKRAAMQRPVTFAALGAAVFAAGVLAGAGMMALRAAEERDREVAKTADAFIEKMAASTQARSVEQDEDSQTYAAVTRQIWSAVKVVAGTAVTNAIHTLFMTLQVSPMLFLVADAGLKAGVQAWAGGSTFLSVLQHTLLATGYASAISMLGNWQLILLPLSVYLLYATFGKGLKTKDSVASGKIFAENMPLIESRLEAEKDPKARAVLAEKLFESVARELKHKKLLDEALINALSQTLIQLKRDLLKGLPPEQCCELAHTKFNKLLSLKFESSTAPAD